MKVVILSGPSGSGKSTWAAKTYPDAIVVSADHFFIDGDTGVYQFDPSKLAVAHAECMKQFLLSLQCDGKVVVVDNTNIHHWERDNYDLAAKLMGWSVDIEFFNVRTVSAIRKCAARNAHGVPLDVVARMALEHENNVFGGGVTHHEVT